MNRQDWLLPKNVNGIDKKPVRHLFYLNEGISIERYKKEMLSSGLKPIQYLPNLGIVVGEFENDFRSQGVEKQTGVQYIESDVRITITEPLLGNIKPLEKQVIPWGVERIEASKVWTKTKGDGVRVAVIDTGIVNDHPAIKNNYIKGFNILSPNYPPQDYNGHGTHVAGTAAGRGSEWGLIGVAPRAHLYAVKAFNRKGSANLSDLLSAINWCIEHKMQVINMSFGMDKLSESLRLAIQVAHRKGIVMVAATGNQGYTSKIDFPSRYPETIAVTSVSKDGSLSSFSNLGKGVDIAAPGDRIPSAWLKNSKREMSGTSMAVPHVSGVVALLLALKPNLNPEQVRYLLVHSAQKKRNLGFNIGVVNANDAVQLMQRS